MHKHIEIQQTQHENLPQFLLESINGRAQTKLNEKSARVYLQLVCLCYRVHLGGKTMHFTQPNGKQKTCQSQVMWTKNATTKMPLETNCADTFLTKTNDFSEQKSLQRFFSFWLNNYFRSIALQSIIDRATCCITFNQHRWPVLRRKRQNVQKHNQQTICCFHVQRNALSMSSSLLRARIILTRSELIEW